MENPISDCSKCSLIQNKFRTHWIQRKQPIYEPVVHTAQFYFHAMDVNKYRYIQNPIGVLFFEEKGYVYPVESVVLELF